MAQKDVGVDVVKRDLLFGNKAPTYSLKPLEGFSVRRGCQLFTSALDAMGGSVVYYNCWCPNNSTQWRNDSSLLIGVIPWLTMPYANHIELALDTQR